jgi:two-component system CheB/CheR fusion protein
VDPDRSIADGMATLLNAYGIEVLSYPDAETFLKSWMPRRCRNCCLIAEADLPGLSGPAMLGELRELHAEIPVLLLIGTSSPDLIQAARGPSPVGVIEKPCVADTLIRQVLKIKEHAGTTDQHRAAGET